MNLAGHQAAIPGQPGALPVDDAAHAAVLDHQVARPEVRRRRATAGVEARQPVARLLRISRSTSAPGKWPNRRPISSGTPSTSCARLACSPVATAPCSPASQLPTSEVGGRSGPGRMPPRMVGREHRLPGHRRHRRHGPAEVLDGGDDPRDRGSPARAPGGRPGPVVPPRVRRCRPPREWSARWAATARHARAPAKATCTFAFGSRDIARQAARPPTCSMKAASAPGDAAVAQAADQHGAAPATSHQQARRRIPEHAGSRHPHAERRAAPAAQEARCHRGSAGTRAVQLGHVAGAARDGTAI